MSIRIVAECPSVARHVLECLQKQGFDVTSSEVQAIDSSNESELEDYAGVLFVAVKELASKHIDSLSRIRLIVNREAKIVVVASETSPAILLKAIRAGACDILSADENLADEIGMFFTRLSTENSEGYTRGKVITVVPCSTSSDANLTAVNMAAIIAQHSKTCGILDFHFRGSDLGILLQLTPRHTILDVLNQPETIDEAMFRQALAVHDSGIELLPGPQYFSDLSNVRFQACQQLIRMAQHCWSTIVINAEDVQHAEQIRSLAISNEVVLTMRPDVASLYRTQKHVEFLLNNHVPSEHIHIVVLGMGHSGELDLATAHKVLRVDHIYGIPDDPVAVVMSINIGNPLVLEKPTSKAALAIKDVVTRIMGHQPADTRAQKSSSMSAVRAASMLALNTLSLCR